jgi:hypothetical protein
MMHARLASTTAALALVVATAACGIRTPPRPPEDTMPRAATELSAERDAGTVRLEWKRPDKSMDGERLADLTEFRVERRSGAGAYTVIAEVPADTAHRLRPIERYSHVDTAPPAGSIEYRIVCETADGQRSPPSVSAFVAPDASGAAPR